AYPEQVTVAESEEAAEMLRRHLLALGGVAMTGATVKNLGELADAIIAPAPTPLPSRLSWMHVDQVRGLTSRISLGDTHYADPDLAGTVAARASQLLDVPGNDPVKHALAVALAELRIEAGRAAGGAWLYRNALHHYPGPGASNQSGRCLLPGRRPQPRRAGQYRARPPRPRAQTAAGHARHGVEDPS
ncbi:MAG: hypothetical protein ACRDRM_09625, partial [Pseudonocardiaceae bacterium]